MTLRRTYWPNNLLYDHYRWLVVVVLLLGYGLMVSSAVRKSATVDEQSHLFRGAAYLQEGATHFLLGHPLLASVISAVPLLTEPNLVLPVDEPFWADGNWSLSGDAFLWRLNDNPHRLLLLGRLPVMWLALLLGALMFRWGRELGGYGAGLFALGLLLSDPNVLAHGRFITGDLAITLFFVLTIYGFWRWATGRGSPTNNILLTGIGLGLAGATKFNAALLLPILAVMGVILAWQRRDWRPIMVLLGAGLVGWAVIWGVYGFEIRPLPGGAFWDDLFWELQYFGKPHGAYLAGEYSTDGWWYYFIVTFFLKTPLPTLFLLFLAFITYRSSFSIPNSALFLLWPAAAYFGFSLTSSLNIGYRYLLPILPFLFLFTAVTLSRLRWRTSVDGEIGILFAAIWLFIIAVTTWPNYIPFFNLLADGRGWQILSDSNVDWGQDLPALAAWQSQTDQPLNLSYFGTAHPSAYGLDFTPLPTWAPAPEQGDPAYQSYNPANPAPGFYAISVTNLHGIVLGQQRDAYAWFRGHEPTARIGGSIFVYEVPVVGEPVQAVFSGVQPADLPPEAAAFFNSNDVHIRWFDARTSLVWPAGGGWQVVSTGQEGDAALAVFESAQPTLVFADETVNLSRLSAPPQFPGQTDVAFGETAVFLGITQLHYQSGEFEVVSGWRVQRGEERPLKIFVHALDSSGEIVGQWDGLDVMPSSWQSGDVFVQLHRFHSEGDLPPAALLIGIYDAVSQERLGEPVFISLNDVFS